MKIGEEVIMFLCGRMVLSGVDEEDQLGRSGKKAKNEGDTRLVIKKRELNLLY